MNINKGAYDKCLLNKCTILEHANGRGEKVCIVFDFVHICVRSIRLGGAEPGIALFGRTHYIIKLLQFWAAQLYHHEAAHAVRGDVSVFPSWNTMFGLILA